MLFELHIKDFILIEDVKIRFEEGFNTITGETGAGKSMILGAIALVLGQQASKEVIRTGCDQAFVSANFFTKNDVNAYLSENGFTVDPDIISISREVQAKGKSISRINGQVATLAHLKAITRFLIDIHGQNDNQVLLIREEQLNLLDLYGGISSKKLRVELEGHYKNLKKIEHEIEKLEEKAHDRQRQIDFLGFQIDEIDSANLKIGEDDLLENEFKMLSDMETIIGIFEKSKSWLSGEYGEGVVATLSTLSSDFERVADYNMELRSFSGRYKELFYMMEDLSKDLMHYEEQLEKNPKRFETVENRLDEINKLKSKYGCKEVGQIIEIKKALGNELESYENIENELENYKKLYDTTLSVYYEVALKLTEFRKTASISFENALQNQLNELNMKETQFKIELNSTKSPTALGMDEIEFMISTNIGQPFRPLKKVVSGGELSRIMLGIKIVLGQMDAMPTLFFDEIDTGISGITANVVGEKLAKLANFSQVICITHLPQIAVFSDHHLLITKERDDSETRTKIRTISGHEIETEIGRLVGGIEQTETTNTHAKEMIEKAFKKKQTFN